MTGSSLRRSQKTDDVTASTHNVRSFFLPPHAQPAAPTAPPVPDGSMRAPPPASAPQTPSGQEVGGAQEDAQPPASASAIQSGWFDISNASFLIGIVTDAVKGLLLSERDELAAYVAHKIEMQTRRREVPIADNSTEASTLLERQVSACQSVEELATVRGFKYTRRISSSSARFVVRTCTAGGRSQKGSPQAGTAMGLAASARNRR